MISILGVLLLSLNTGTDTTSSQSEYKIIRSLPNLHCTVPLVIILSPSVSPWHELISLTPLESFLLKRWTRWDCMVCSLRDLLQLWCALVISHIYACVVFHCWERTAIEYLLASSLLCFLTFVPIALPPGDSSPCSFSFTLFFFRCQFSLESTPWTL